MGFLVDRWRGIGTRLYLALAFAVLLTLVSSGVAVFYFERSGDLNYQAESEAVPVLEASWEAAREAERLRSLGWEMLTATDAQLGNIRTDTVDQSLARLEQALTLPNSVPSLSPGAVAVQDAAYGVANAIDAIALKRAEILEADAAAAELRQRMAAIPADTETSVAGLRLLERVLRAESQAELDGMWDEFTALAQLGLEAPIAAVGGGDGVFAARARQLLLMEENRRLAVDLTSAGAVLEGETQSLLDGARAHSSEALGLAVQSFDQGRVLLAVISVVSVIAATLAAWLWVGNAVVSRLSRLSERMRGMAAGDLETLVPEVGRDEIGQLAGALEHFRQQALEVQRLNLVEQLYGELREANAELQRMQARLVAQEKLAALGELVSGVAHEISNPLNFVKNFSEGSLDLYSELAEMLANYRDRMSEDDASLLDELTGEITESLNRVSYNGGRALAIVERMRSLSTESGTPVMTDLNGVLRQAVQQGCESYMQEYGDFRVEPVFDLDSAVGETLLVEREFGEALVNLVSNACYAMHRKQEEADGSYSPALAVSTRLADGVIEVRVRDNGPGIADDVLGRIFNPFFTTREGILGAGLGLPIAADIARRMGGDLVVDTALGEFAEFTMHVPVAQADGPEADEEGAGETAEDAAVSA